MRRSGPVALIDLDGTLADYNSALERDLKTIASEIELSDSSWRNEALPHVKKKNSLNKISAWVVEKFS